MYTKFSYLSQFLTALGSMFVLHEHGAHGVAGPLKPAGSPK